MSTTPPPPDPPTRPMRVHVRQYSRWQWTAHVTWGSVGVLRIHALTEKRLLRKVSRATRRLNRERLSAYEYAWR